MAIKVQAFRVKLKVRHVTRLLLTTILTCFISCGMQDTQPNVKEAIAGNWLVLYPDHQRNNAIQTAIYAKAQDSIVNLMGLKLISFNEGGKCQLVDSLFRKTGNWNVNLNELTVRGAGKGWDNFEGRMIGFRNDTLQVVEYIPLRGDSIRIVWFMKKINAGDKAARLFEEDLNAWRKKTSASETKKQLAVKVKQMLEYYALYFEVVSEESAYFVGSRAALPIRYYQHAAGLLPFDDQDAFSQVFFNRQNAAAAYDILEDAIIKDMKKPFPRGKDYVIEYSKFLSRVAGRIQ